MDRVGAAPRARVGKKKKAPHVCVAEVQRASASVHIALATTKDLKKKYIVHFFKHIHVVRTLLTEDPQQHPKP